MTFSKNIGKYLQHVQVVSLKIQVVSLKIQFPYFEDPILDNLDKFLNGKGVSESVSVPKGWFREHLTLHQIQRSIKDLLQFKDVNGNSSIKSIYVISLPEHPANKVPSAEIRAYYYYQGRRLQEEQSTEKRRQEYSNTSLESPGNVV